MTLRLLADENADHGVVHRLVHYGHDVEHVDDIPDLGKGAEDGCIATYSIQTGRGILTNDDDFLVEFGDEEYSALLFVEDDSLGPTAIADIVDEIGSTIEPEPDGVFSVSRNWL